MRPEELLEVGFARSRVVMVNEAHNGLLRCVRTREIGRRMLPVAHGLGVRHLAMEALGPPGYAWSLPRGGYLEQPEMAMLLELARELGIELHGYESDHTRAPSEIARDTMSLPYTNWREREQARDLVDLLERLGQATRLLVWCGNSHVSRDVSWTGRLPRKWVLMGWHFQRMAGFAHFAIDQTVTVRFRSDSARSDRLVEEAKAALEERGGTAGFLQDGRMKLRPGVDAVLLSLHNLME
jgi:hypothetical protein